MDKAFKVNEDKGLGWAGRCPFIDKKIPQIKAVGYNTANLLTSGFSKGPFNDHSQRSSF
jgi:hypothetical protein